jgi:hypothetical protein
MAMEDVLSRYPALNAAFNEFLRAHPEQVVMPDGIRFIMAPEQFPLQLYDDLRTTDFAVFAHRMGAELSVTLRRKQYLLADRCFHISARSNAESIAHHGLHLGRVVAQGPHHAMFADSIHYIFASLTEAAAVEWSRRLPTRGERVMFSIDLRALGCRLFEDPCSRGNGGCEGYIIDSVHVPPQFLGHAVVCP